MSGVYKGQPFSLLLCSAPGKMCRTASELGSNFSPMKAEGLQSSCPSSGLHQSLWLQPRREGIEFTHRDVMRADNCTMVSCEVELCMETGRIVSSADTHLAPRCGLDHPFCSRDSMHSKHPVSGGLRPSHQFPSTPIGQPQPAAPNQLLASFLSL